MKADTTSKSKPMYYFYFCILPCLFADMFRPCVTGSCSLAAGSSKHYQLLCSVRVSQVRVLSLLDHPNIISYYDSFDEDGVLMIEMEYADGG